MKKRTFDAVVAGHICLDITPEFLSAGKTRIKDVLRPGSLLFMGAATLSTGGAVANVGFAMRRLGLNVLLMGKCADDAFGRLLVSRIRAEAPGAEKSMTVSGNEPTSYSVVIAPPAIDRIFLHCPGANNTFEADDVNLDIVRTARLFHFGYPPLMRRMYADNGVELSSIFRRVKKTGTPTSLDMAMPDLNSDSGHADWPLILKKTLPYVDFFVPSAEEIMVMLDRPRYERLRRAAGGREILDIITAADIAHVGDACIRLGAKIVLIKCGKHGVYVRTAGQKALESISEHGPDAANWGSRELWQPSFAVKKLVSATGSGDSAIAGFLSAYLNGCGIETALRYCCMIGCQNLQAADATSGIRTWQETTRMIRGRMRLNPVPVAMNGWRQDTETGIFSGPSDKA